MDKLCLLIQTVDEKDPSTFYTVYISWSFHDHIKFYNNIVINNICLDHARYIYFEATNVEEGETAVLQSGQFNPNMPERCMTFAYHVYGGDMGSLELDLVTGSNRQNLLRVSESVNQWVLARADIPRSTESFKVRYYCKVYLQHVFSKFKLCSYVYVHVCVHVYTLHVHAVLNAQN